MRQAQRSKACSEVAPSEFAPKCKVLLQLNCDQDHPEVTSRRCAIVTQGSGVDELSWKLFAERHRKTFYVRRVRTTAHGTEKL